MLLYMSLKRISPITSSGSLSHYPTMVNRGDTTIIDIRSGPTKFDILQDIRAGLRPQDGGEKTLPTLMLYDEAGLRLFEKITYLVEYYLTNAEIEVLETYADRIAENIRPGSIIVELGSGYDPTPWSPHLAGPSTRSALILEQ